MKFDWFLGMMILGNQCCNKKYMVMIIVVVFATTTTVNGTANIQTLLYLEWLYLVLHLEQLIDSSWSRLQWNESRLYCVYFWVKQSSILKVELESVWVGTLIVCMGDMTNDHGMINDTVWEMTVWLGIELVHAISMEIYGWSIW